MDNLESNTGNGDNTDSASNASNANNASEINEVLSEYNNVIQNKLQLEKKLVNLEKKYLRLIIRSCNHETTVCDNCWQLVRFFRGRNEHIYNGGFICKKRTVGYQMAKAAKDVDTTGIANLDTTGIANVTRSTDAVEPAVVAEPAEPLESTSSEKATENIEENNLTQVKTI